MTNFDNEQAWLGFSAAQRIGEYDALVAQIVQNVISAVVRQTLERLLSEIAAGHGITLDGIYAREPGLENIVETLLQPSRLGSGGWGSDKLTQSNYPEEGQS